MTAALVRTTTLRPVAPLTGRSHQDGVIDRFRQVLQAQPDAVAVTDATRELTFAQVAVEAAGVLSAVRAAVGPTSEPIALLHSHDAGAVCALLAILGSGHPVLVLDPRTPVPRLKVLLERVNVRFCVTDATHAETAATLVPNPVRTPSPPRYPVGSVLPDGTEALWLIPPDPDSAAVIAFTSGSTGRPKVVVNDHRMLVRDAWTNSYATGCYDSDDVIAHTLPMAFHAGLMVTVAGLMVGCTMKLYDVRGSGIAGLADWVEREQATVMHTSPAILRAFLASGPTAVQLRSLSSLTIAGEAAYSRDVEPLRHLLPVGCTVRNRYGSSETGLIAEFAITAGQSLATGALPTGFAVGDTVLGLVDADGQPVPAGESGTVTVTAPRVALGYWGDPAATESAFTDLPDGTRTYVSSDLGRFDAEGRLHLLGRRDHSVKVRGYLVEPGEVDAALFALDDVREAIVVGVTRPGNGRTSLVAYVVSSAERHSAVDLRAALSLRLPSYMVPETVVFLSALPRTDRGKLDRSALPEPPAPTAGSSGQELTDWEVVVQHAWCLALALPDVGLDDDFFELGGDSLAAQTLMSLMVSELGVSPDEATSSALAQAPTLGTFARQLRRKPDPENETLIPLRTTGSLPPLFIAAGGGGLGVTFVPMARRLDPEQPAYALQAHALEQRGVPDWSVEAAARRHVASIRRVQPEGPYYLAGHSFGGLLALEMAHQLRRAGQEVALLVMLDSFPPDPSLIPAPQRSVMARVRGFLSLAGTGLRSSPGQDECWRFYEQSAVLHRRYRCAPWPGRTLVVLADSPEREDRAKWAPHLSGPWEMVEVKGDHFSLLREPDAGETAAVVGRALREAQQMALREAQQMALPEGQQMALPEGQQMALPEGQQISLRETQQTTLIGAQQHG
jgi:acyl-coenzyme A synthetase/AMP-(fatty) acid ligase/thioesterase domain-containing protein